MANLMETNEANSSPESLIVNVKDHDIPGVPDDLGGGSSSFWKQKDVRIWLYILGAAVMILVIVFVLLSRQTSLFKGYTRVAVNNDSNTVSEGDLEDYNGSAANENFDGVGGDDVVGEGEGDFATTPGEDGSVNIDDFLDGVFNPDDLEANPDELDSLFDDLDLGDEDPVNEGTDGGDDNGEPVITDPFAPSDLFPSAPSIPSNPDIIVNQNNEFAGMDLNSNTDSGVMESPIVQGDTGPSVMLALIPSIFYAVVRRRKYEA